MEHFWKLMGELLREHDTIIETPLGQVHKLCSQGFIEIYTDGKVYRSIPQEYGIGWVCWEPFHILSHFSEIKDPKATAAYKEHRHRRV